MLRALTILTAVVALAVSAAPAWAGTPEAAKGACVARGFMDYTDDSCMAKAGPSKEPRATVTLKGGEILSDFVTAPPKSSPLHENEGIDGGF